MAIEAQTERKTILSRNPADNSVAGEVTIASAEEVRAAVERAKSAQTAWNARGVRGRIDILKRFQRLLYERKEQVAQLVTSESGKPRVEALLTEVLVGLDAARFLIDHAYQLLRPEKVAHGNLVMKPRRGRLIREPYGVVGIISPWNYPFSIPTTETLAALVAGNAVVLKPSELTPLAGMELARLLHEAGVPRDVVQVVNGEGAVGAALIESRIDKLFFTGSVATGKKVAEIAARRLLPVVLELGGKDPMIVLDDVNVDMVSSAAVWGAFVNAGQTCLSVERCYVQRKIFDQFVKLCAEKAQKLSVGNGADPNTDVGPMIHERQLRIVEDQVADACARGARVVTGGKRMAELGPNFYAPTVLTGVTHEMRIMREETFGPVLPIMPFDTDDEAVALANDSAFGLAASVWARDHARAERMASRIEAGTVLVNDVVTGFGISEAPHGGIKNSGIGRTHGKIGLEEMVRPKYVDVDLIPGMKKIWWYGYGEDFSRQMLAFVDMLFARSMMKRAAGAVKSAGAMFRKQV